MGNTIKVTTSATEITDCDGDAACLAQPGSPKWPWLYLQINRDNHDADLAHVYLDVPAAKAFRAEIDRYLAAHDK